MGECTDCKEARSDEPTVRVAKVGMPDTNTVIVGEYRPAWECEKCSALNWLDGEPSGPAGQDIPITESA